MTKGFTIRETGRKDVGLLLEFIKGIAKYEKMEDEVVATAETLEAEMFNHHRAEALERLTQNGNEEAINR